VESDAATLGSVLRDVETIVNNLKARNWSDVADKTRRLATDKQIKEVFWRVFVDNTRKGGVLARVNRQELLRDLASISDLKGFQSAFRNLKSTSTKKSVGSLREIRVAAADRRMPGRVVENIDVHIKTKYGKSDIDVISDDILWQVKTGKNPTTIAGGWAKLDTW